MAPISKGRARDAGRSRNSTPMSATSIEPPNSANRPTTPTPSSYAEIAELCRSANTPTSAILKKIMEALRQREEIARQRADVHDKGMRESSRRKKEELERQKEQALIKREDEERQERLRIQTPKKEPEERPPVVGAHSVARQDGEVDEDGDAKMSPLANGVEAPSSRGSTPSPQQPKPAPAIPQYQTFGPDPSTFNDPTIYHIRSTQGATEEEKKQIYGVTDYPHQDLQDLTAGVAPDRDLTNAKPSTQISAQVFANYLEPFFRPFTEEDVQFLKERGDRATPMIIPPRGSKSYKDTWAEEDNSQYSSGSVNNSAPSSTNQGAGSMDQMTEDVAEQGGISLGPMLSRLLQCLRPERRPTDATTNGDATNGDVEADGTQNQEDIALLRQLPPATFLPESATLAATKTAVRPSWSEMDDRVKQELRYIGFLSEDAEADYDGHYDDEIAARLRWLQEELQRISTVNGARKTIVLDMVEDDMARQEWVGIQDDLDSQLNQAYLKRHRNTGKSKGKIRRPGASGLANGTALPVNGVSRPSVGEPIRQLMERREMWRSILGAAVDYGKREVPAASVFNEAKMATLIGQERDFWSEAQDGS